MESWIIRTLADKKNISVHDANYSLFSVLINIVQEEIFVITARL